MLSMWSDLLFRKERGERGERGEDSADSLSLSELQSMCGRGELSSTVNMAASFPGVLDGQISQYSLENAKHK